MNRRTLIQSVMAGVSAMEPHFARFPGKSQWDLTLLIGVADAQGQSTKHLALQSDLKGIAIDLVHMVNFLHTK